jgi:ankyrin repeat protein
MNDVDKRIKASYQLFDKVKCCLRDLNGDFNDTALAFMEMNKMRHHILNCMASLHVIEMESDKKEDADEVELVKREVFTEAILMMMNTKCDINDEQIVSAFPDDDDLSNEKSWLPLHIAIALTVGNRISEQKVHVLHAANPLAMHSFSEIDKRGYTPIHLLCMQKRPSMSLVRKMCLRDPQAFILCGHSGKSALHLVAQYSESLEVLQSVLQIDHTLTRKKVDVPYRRSKVSPLGLLFGRSDFPSFHEMFLCLIDIDSTVEVIFDGIHQCILQYKGSPNQETSPGSRGNKSLILIGKLLDANADVTKYSSSRIFHLACYCLRGELGIAVLNLFLSKNSEGIKSFRMGSLPLHVAAMSLSLDVIQFLLKVNPESLTMVTSEGDTLLLIAVENESNVTDVKAIVDYLYNRCPALMHMKNSQGYTPVHWALQLTGKLRIEIVKILCNIDESVVRDKCTPTDITEYTNQQLALHLLIDYNTPILEVSNEGDCFRLFLRLYPASAGIKDGHLKTPYDLAIDEGLSVYFLRLLLNADPSIDPVERHNLNYAARREGMFLAFRALSTTVEPTIWAKLRHEDRDLLRRVITYL